MARVICSAELLSISAASAWIDTYPKASTATATKTHTPNLVADFFIAPPAMVPATRGKRVLAPGRSCLRFISRGRAAFLVILGPMTIYSRLSLLSRQCAAAHRDFFRALRLDYGLADALMGGTCGLGVHCAGSIRPPASECVVRSAPGAFSCVLACCPPALFPLESSVIAPMTANAPTISRPPTHLIITAAPRHGSRRYASINLILSA